MNIQESPAGKVVKLPTGYTAFVPHPLPPNMVWSNDVINSLSRADYILGKLSREGGKLRNSYLLIRQFITREALLSSKIEGARTTISELLAHEAGAAVVTNAQDLQEIKNYIVALDYGLHLLQEELPLSLRLLKQMHHKLMHGVRGEYATPGEFRRTQNWIGAPGSTLVTAKYVPPHVDELMNCLSSFELFLHDKQLPPLVHVALCHYQFEAIHPFVDGNGRIGRLLITLLLIERKILPSPLLYLSAFFEATRDEYYRHLYNVSAHGNWHDWLVYFLNGVAVQSADALSRSERINSLIEGWIIKVGGASSVVAMDIIKYSVANPFFTTKKVAENLKVSFTTAQRALKRLESLNIITQTTEGKRSRVYCAKEILSIIEEPAQLAI